MRVTTDSKIKSQAEIRGIAENLRGQGKKIVTCNGSYDLLHYGHIMFLEEARAQGDILIVGVNSNVSIRKYKSADRPIIDEKYRLASVAALECVNYTVLLDEAEIAVPLISLARPHVHVNGEEYGEDCVEAPALRAIGARLHLVKKVPGFSTTELIEKILKIFGR